MVIVSGKNSKKNFFSKIFLSTKNFLDLEKFLKKIFFSLFGLFCSRHTSPVAGEHREHIRPEIEKKIFSKIFLSTKNFFFGLRKNFEKNFLSLLFLSLACGSPQILGELHHRPATKKSRDKKIFSKFFLSPKKIFFRFLAFFALDALRPVLARVKSRSDQKSKKIFWT